MAPRAPFRLSSTLAGHAADVRSLASSPAGPVLFSSSRDGTARSWYQGAMQEDGKGGGGWTEGVAFTGQHDGFVNAVEWITGDGEGEIPFPVLGGLQAKMQSFSRDHPCAIEYQSAR